MEWSRDAARDCWRSRRFIPADIFLTNGSRGRLQSLSTRVGASALTTFVELQAVRLRLVRRSGVSEILSYDCNFILLRWWLWPSFLPVLGNYRGFPIEWATVITLIGLLIAFIAFERTLVLTFHFLTRPSSLNGREEWTPGIGRRAFLLSGLGVVVAGGGLAVLRKLYRAATFSYDGTQYKGHIVQAITPNEQFYCVTKNVVDPVVDASHWQLQITGLVKTPPYRFEELKSLPRSE